MPHERMATDAAIRGSAHRCGRVRHALASRRDLDQAWREMSRTGRLIAVLVGLAIVAALVIGSQRRSDAPASMPAGATAVEIETPVAPGAPGAPTTAAPTAAGAGAPAPSPVRTRIPRPPSLPAQPAPAAPAAHRATTAATTELKGPIDRRGPGAPAVKMAELGGKLDTIADDIEQCVAAWQELDPSIDGTATLAFQIGPAGLTDVWLAEHAELPAAAATCFSSAVYAIDWAGLTDGPIEITQRYQDGVEGAP
jgi:hypothetical protein